MLLLIVWIKCGLSHPKHLLYHISKGEVELQKTIMSDKDTLSPFKFNAGTQDRDDNIWFATEGDGVYCYRKNRKPILYITRQMMA